MCSPRVSAQGFLKLWPLRKLKSQPEIENKIFKILKADLVPSLSLDGNVILKNIGEQTSDQRKNHAVAIVGQKLSVRGICEYLIRDSETGRILKISRHEIIAASDQLFEPIQAKITSNFIQRELDLPVFKNTTSISSSEFHYLLRIMTD